MLQAVGDIPRQENERNDPNLQPQNSFDNEFSDLDSDFSDVSSAFVLCRLLAK